MALPRNTLIYCQKEEKGEFYFFGGIKKYRGGIMSRSKLIVIVFLTLMIGVALATVPHSCKRAYELGTGGAFDRILRYENLQWGPMSNTERAPYVAQAKTSGLQLSIYILLGQYIPFYLFIAITIGHLSRPASRFLKNFLWMSFLLTWIVGLFFLSFFSLQWKNYWRNESYLASFGSALLIYIFVAILFGTILGIGRLIQFLLKKRGQV